MSATSHRVVSNRPFIVEFINGDKTTKCEFAVMLTTAEIRAQYDYITFEEPMHFMFTKYHPDPTIKPQQTPVNYEELMRGFRNNYVADAKFEVKPITQAEYKHYKIELLMTEINNLKKEIDNAEKPSLKHNSAEDVDDLYQARLEYNWWLDSQLKLIRSLEDELKTYL